MLPNACFNINMHVSYKFDKWLPEYFSKLQRLIIDCLGCVFCLTSVYIQSKYWNTNCILGKRLVWCELTQHSTDSFPSLGCRQSRDGCGLLAASMPSGAASVWQKQVSSPSSNTSQWCCLSAMRLKISPQPRVSWTCALLTTMKVGLTGRLIHSHVLIQCWYL